MTVLDASSGNEPGLRSTITEVGGRLARALHDLVAALPGQPTRPQDVARALKVDKNAAHRLMTAIRQRDPIATIYHLPGPRPLRRLVDAGVRKGVSPSIASAARDAVAAFDALLQREGGDRSVLDAVIPDWLPDVRPASEHVAKQLMYRGARQLKGVAADAVLYTVVLHPSADPGYVSFVQLQAYLGLRRVRPSASLKMNMWSNVNDPGFEAFTLDGEPISDVRGLILRQFCSGEDIELEVHSKGPHVLYAMKWGSAVGYNSARDIVMSDYRPRGLRRFRLPDDPRPRSGVTDAINVPTRTYVADLIMHTDVYPQWEPKVRVLETGEEGAADPNDPSRDLEVLDLAETIVPLGTGVERFRAAEVPQYIEMLSFVCAKLGWDPASFRAYRTRIEYPIFGSQVQFAFDLPVLAHDQRPADAGSTSTIE